MRTWPHLKHAGSRLQWVHGPRTVVMRRDRLSTAHGVRSFNGSTVREPWLWRRCSRDGRPQSTASMGPRSENRGYAASWRAGSWLAMELQWVHGPRTVVMIDGTAMQVMAAIWLQWVHGPRTVVMGDTAGLDVACQRRLQWVHGPRTVVMVLQRPVNARGRIELQWVHGPRTVVMSSVCPDGLSTRLWLQWVHGPRTVVMSAPWAVPTRAAVASMGPRSENRGYGCEPCQTRPGRDRLQWVHGPRTVVMVDMHVRWTTATRGFNGSTVREPWLWQLGCS